LKGVGEEELWQVVHPRLRHEFPPLNTLDALRHNLPVPTEPLLGRENEIAAWQELLTGHESKPLLTLTWHGRHGQNARCATISRKLCGQLQDGVWWVELEQACNAEDMISRIVSVLRFSLQSHVPVREQLHNYFRERQMLLVLDNTEQISDAPLVVRDLLARLLSVGAGHNAPFAGAAQRNLSRSARFT
jgi:hypothetical protein